MGIKVSWEDAVYLAAERARIKGVRKTDVDNFVKHSGKHWKIYYYYIGHFEEDLPFFGKFLEEISERGEEVSAIVPNMGWVPASIVLGTSFQGVKGFAVITKMAREAKGEFS